MMSATRFPSAEAGDAARPASAALTASPRTNPRRSMSLPGLDVPDPPFIAGAAEEPWGRARRCDQNQTGIRRSSASPQAQWIAFAPNGFVNFSGSKRRGNNWPMVDCPHSTGEKAGEKAMSQADDRPITPSTYPFEPVRSGRPGFADDGRRRALHRHDAFACAGRPPDREDDGLRPGRLDPVRSDHRGNPFPRVDSRRTGDHLWAG